MTLHSLASLSLKMHLFASVFLKWIFSVNITYKLDIFRTNYMRKISVGKIVLIIENNLCNISC